MLFQTHKAPSKNSMQASCGAMQGKECIFLSLLFFFFSFLRTIARLWPSALCIFLEALFLAACLDWFAFVWCGEIHRNTSVFLDMHAPTKARKTKQSIQTTYVCRNVNLVHMESCIVSHFPMTPCRYRSISFTIYFTCGMFYCMLYIKLLMFYVTLLSQMFFFCFLLNHSATTETTDPVISINVLHKCVLIYVRL